MGKRSGRQSVSFVQMCQLGWIVVRATYRLREWANKQNIQSVLDGFATDTDFKLDMLARRLRNELADAADYDTKGQGRMRLVK